MKNWQNWVLLFSLAVVVFAGAMIFYSIKLSSERLRDACAATAVTSAALPPADAAATSPRVAAIYPSGDTYSVFGGSICATLADIDKRNQANAAEPLILFLNGQAMGTLTGAASNPVKQLYQFKLSRTGKNGETNDVNIWSELIGAPPFTGDTPGRVSLAVSVGTAKDGPWPSDGATISFLVFSPLVLACGVLAMLAAIAVIVLLGKYTGLLRDGDATSTYSLGRVQMAWWLYLVTASFLYIWLITGQFSGVLTSDCLVLLGISGATGLAAMVIPPPASPAPAAAAPAGGAGAAVPAAPAPAAPAPASRQITKSRGFLKDLLYSDIDGADCIQLHRIQMVVWTVILGMVFVWEVYSSFRMPTFDANLLIMMGISGSLYLGFKFRET